MTATTAERSPAGEFVEQFRHFGPDVAPSIVLAAWDALPILEQAALAADWSFWARPKQLAPVGAWRTWGFLTGRRFGKTLAISKWINEEVEAGRARLLGCCAQDEQSAFDIQILGPSGLIATAPPWNRPVWEASALRLTWPNGATLHVRTPEVPGKIRGLDYDLYWASELQSWPTATRDEAWAMVELSTSVGLARIVWDATPKRRHPVIKARLADIAADPARHYVVRGTTHENSANLADEYVAELERKYAGTTRGREELLGEMLDEAEGALWRQAWIDDHRRPCPKLLRRALSIDPSVSDRPGSDTSGYVEAGLGVDGRGYVLADRSGKYKPEAWAEMLLDDYVAHACDVIIAETNKGGQLVASTLRAYAKLRGLQVVVLEKEERPARQPGKVFVQEVHARGSKEERAVPAATAYERGRVSHVVGADLESLENTLTTWEPPPPEKRREDSPGDLDALVHACVELLDLAENRPDLKKQFVGLPAVAARLAAPAPARAVSLPRAISAALNRTTDRI